MAERGYKCSDIVTEWYMDEDALAGHILDKIAYWRGERKSRPSTNIEWLSFQRQRNFDEMSLDDMKEICEELAVGNYQLVIENDSLKKQLNNTAAQTDKMDRPLLARSRRTLLTIIAALCNHIEINWQSRGVSQRIREMTESLGAPVDDGTIAKALSEIPEALETRIK